MKLRTLLFALALALPFAASSAQTIPDGTVLPVMLSPTLDARHSKPGQKITGRIKQDVPLPGGSSIPRNSTIVGQVVSATPTASGSPSRLAIKFDSVSVKGRQIPITAHLRALASMSEVFEARMPTNALDDYGTSPSDWNTVQVGGAGVFRGSGQLIGERRGHGSRDGRRRGHREAGRRSSQGMQRRWRSRASAVDFLALGVRRLRRE